jgi:Mce-associated membrane protein
MATAETELTGGFLEYYRKYATDTVIPNSKKDQIATTWTLMGSAVVSAEPSSAEVLVYLNGVVTKAGVPPNTLASSVRLHMQKVGGKWLISSLEPL